VTAINNASINAERVNDALLTDDEIRAEDCWSGAIPFGDLEDFAWDIARRAVSNALRNIAEQATNGSVSIGQLERIAREILPS
jgi:hypothetical protein